MVDYSYLKYDRNFKYGLKEMVSTTDDYKLIKKAFEVTIRNCTVETHKIYRVKQRVSDNSSKQKNDNMLLFHGTNLESAVGILKGGFKPTTIGKFGPGVYLTESPSCAVSYTVAKTYNFRYYDYRHYNYDKKQKFLFSIFVNEVLESDTLKIVKYDERKNYHLNEKRENQFEKYIVKGAIERDSDETFEKDSKGTKIRTSPAKERDDSNHYVCHENYVLPRYLIQFYSNLSFDNR